MTRADLTEKLLDIKREKGWTWKYICEQIGGMSPVLVTGAILRGSGTAMPPTDPLIYRFYELVMVNGPALKALIEEEFGDGIMSAIDFDMEISRQSDPKGDRVRIAMSGKFLPYKYYGATGNNLQYGLKEP
jgi:cyanate lyase